MALVTVEVAVGIFDWLEPKMTSLIEHHGMTWWDDILQWEYGARRYKTRGSSRDRQACAWLLRLDAPCAVPA